MIIYAFFSVRLRRPDPDYSIFLSSHKQPFRSRVAVLYFDRPEVLEDQPVSSHPPRTNKDRRARRCKRPITLNAASLLPTRRSGGSSDKTAGSRLVSNPHVWPNPTDGQTSAGEPSDGPKQLSSRLNSTSLRRRINQLLPGRMAVEAPASLPLAQPTPAYLIENSCFLDQFERKSITSETNALL